MHAFAEATAIEPTRAGAWNGRAVVLAAMGRMEEARKVLQDAYPATRGDLAILTNLALLHERLGSYQEAIDAAEIVLAATPDNSAARHTLGLALLRFGLATEASDHFFRLTAEQPDNPEAFLNLGEALMVADDYSAARDAYSQAVALSPALIEARIGLGQALAMLAQFDEADALFAEANRLDPQGAATCFRRMAIMAGQRVPFGWQARAKEVFLSRHWARQQVCDWRFRDDYLTVLRDYANQLAETGKSAYDLSLGFQSLAAPLTTQQRRGLLDAVANWMVTSTGSSARWRRTRLSDRLRLGFLSADFREHPAAQLHWRQLALHDRSRYQVHAYSLVNDDNSRLRQRVVESVDVFRDISQATATEAAWRIARDGIDILVDITGHLDMARPEILALRPAPIRVSLMGSPVSLGSVLVDYRVSDQIATPDDLEFTEAIARLPNTHFIYCDEEPIADRSPSRGECGLPEDAFVFCAFNSSFKIEPEVFEVWIELLRRVPHGILWLRSDCKAVVDNLSSAAAEYGIQPSRLVFAPWMERSLHLARHACADLFIDTFVCNAHTTAADALWAGLPVLTRTGSTMASRIAASLVTAAGLPELVVTTTEDYLNRATSLARMPDLLGNLRQRLKGSRRNVPLFATRRRVQHLEVAFETMWERHCRGEPPATFEVPDR